ncbi:hypothetical protein TanjilG_03899 [Lupinus angustifolius]|uniref:DUF7812 domain-containing protein n=1 Tax=Lupinus angustifolius TaxID=3871 RepID=A0A4P1R5P1_LUPAN|nr:PREDICTED: uncharacterized protein LOC109361305 isoform X1 [Lupinus angustifolius]OIW01761.1 hypothetical protein TanjilG_03899 [Lupinus angustifolius]
MDTEKLYHSLTNPHSPIPKDRNTLFETLFHQLHTTFHKFFVSLPLFNNNVSQSGSDSCSHSRIWSIVEDLSYNLRCCLVVLTLPENTDQKFIIVKCRFILQALKAFVSVEVGERGGNKLLRFRNFADDVDMELCDSASPFLCAVLEVFADELLRHQSLRRYLMITDSRNSISEKLFACHVNHGDTASVLEVISAHFILSVSNGNTFENFIGRLFLHCGKDSGFPKLSIATAILLLLDPIALSAPKIFQAHIISLVSEVIGSGLSSENFALDINYYLTAFQKSVTLYSTHVSSLQMDGFNVELKFVNQFSLLERSQTTFVSYIQQVTSNRLNQVLSKADNTWHSSRCKMSSKTKANLLTECISFMKGRQYIFPDSYRDTSASTLDCLIHQTFSQDVAGDGLYTKENTSAADIFFLASILKLMSISLIQAIKSLSNSGDSGCLKTMGNTSVREKYDFLISIINHFQQFKLCLPVQTFLYNIMKSQQTNVSASKSMLVHFSGLLSLCFSSGLDLLAKGCISVIMALMYLFIFEEGDLVTLGSLRDLPLQSCSSAIPSDKTREGGRDKQSISKVAAEFHRVRTRKSRCDSIVEDEKEETCSGEIFLDCILDGSKKLSDYDELADFFECEKEKDYSSWLKGRQKFRKRRHEKMIYLRKIKKKKIWKSMNCQKSGQSSRLQKMGKRLKH